MQRSESFAIPNQTQLKEGANYIESVHEYEGPVGALSMPLHLRVSRRIPHKLFLMRKLLLSPNMGNGFSGGHVSSFYRLFHFNEQLQTNRCSSSARSYLYPPTQQLNRAHRTAS
ncbi:hypothetical protein EV361DRAFT_49132 [Lentinula raphanica]|nr:hypothetical protein EV361DRAFT_49132 [Lentinula raphanica]